MQQIDLNQAKTQADALFQAALRGEEIIITDNEQPVLRLTRVTSEQKRRQSGSAKGLIKMADDFDEPLAEFQDYLP